MILPTIFEFIEKQKRDSYYRINANGYVKAEGFKSVYVRFGPKYIDYRYYTDVLDLANIVADRPRKGSFNKLVEIIKQRYPTVSIYVENVIDPEFGNALIRKGFEEVRTGYGFNSYFLKGDCKNVTYKYDKTQNNGFRVVGESCEDHRPCVE